MEEFKNNLIKITNESNLPIEAIYFVVKDFYRDVEDAFKQYKANAAAQSQRSEEPVEKKKEENE